MKRFSKILVNILAVLMLTAVCFNFVACEDLTTLQVTVSVYDEEEAQMVEKDMKFVLYRHLAKDTVNAIVDYVNEGHYNDTVFYIANAHSSQIMVGDLKYVDNNIVQNTIKPQIKGEFYSNGVPGSDLSNTEGALGLWRSFYANGGTTVSDDSRDSGRSTWYMPTSSLANAYDKYMCVFGLMQLSDAETSEAWRLIKKACTSLSERYTIYYTGEYDETKPNENFGLTYHCELTTEFEKNRDEITDLFTAEGSQFSNYSYYSVNLPVTDVTGAIKAPAAKIVSVKVV